MPLPIDSNGGSIPPPLGAAALEDRQQQDDNQQNGAQNGIRQRLGGQGVEYAIANNADHAPLTRSTMSWCDALRLFVTSVSPLSTPGVTLPRITVPRARGDLADIAMALTGSMGYSSVMRGGRMVYSMVSSYWNRGRRPTPPPMVNLNVELESEITRDDSGLFSPPAAPLTPSQELPAPEPIARPRHPSAHLGRPSTDVNIRRRMRPDNFDSVRLLVAAVQQSSQFAQESMRIMEEADAREERAIAPDALDRLPQQVVCEVEDGEGFSMDVSWVNPDGSYGEETVYCLESNSLEVPRHASSVYLDRFGGTDLSGRVLTRVRRHSLVTEGHIYDPVHSQASQLIKLARILARDGQWQALGMVADHVLRDVEETKAPDLVAQMREFKAQAEHHRPPSLDQPSVNFLGEALVGLLASGVIYTALRWYQAYRSGERGVGLFARPFMDMAEGVRFFFRGNGQAADSVEPVGEGDALLEVVVAVENLEELGAVGGDDNGWSAEDEWLDDEFFDYQ